MCIFCGDFIMQIHWTDQKKQAVTDEVIVGEDQRERQRTRLHKVQLCNEILTFYQMKLRDWNGSKFILEDLKGNSRIVHDLGALWHNVEQLLGRPINPLDPYLMDVIKNK